MLLLLMECGTEAAWKLHVHQASHTLMTHAAPCVCAQGEESDVVIASLVRSNSSGKVGFLKDAERANVLISRARHGLILIGDASHLSHAKGCEHWVRLLRMLAESKAILSGLPAVCQVHGTQAMLDSPAAFQMHAPQGGCQKMCEQKMACSHTCKLPCHPYDLSHDRIKCSEIMFSYCSEGHDISHRCALVCAQRMHKCLHGSMSERTAI